MGRSEGTGASDRLRAGASHLSRSRIPKLTAEGAEKTKTPKGATAEGTERTKTPKGTSAEGTERTETPKGTSAEGTERTEATDMRRDAGTGEFAGKLDALNALTYPIIGAAMRIHRSLGPGLLESAYEACLFFELVKLGFGVERQKPIPLVYDAVTLDCGYRDDLVVNRAVLVELKAVARLEPIHEAQVMSHLKLTGLRVALLMNFNVLVFRDGLRRYFHNF